MTTLFNPLVDNKKTISSGLSSAIVESWDMKDCVDFSELKLYEQMNDMSLEEYVDQFENFHHKSIITTIDWVEITSIKFDWNNIASCICNPSMMDGYSQFYTVGNDDDDVELWIVEIYFHDGTHIAILHTDNQQEAEIIADSISKFYVDDCVSAL